MNRTSTANALPLARRTDDFVGSVIDSSTTLLAGRTHDIVKFAMGAPGEDLIPVEQLDEISGRYSKGRFDYGETAGEPALIEQIVALTESHGFPTSGDRITVTGGAMQGLDIACKLFVNPGDVVIVEGPTYTNANATALSYGARLLEAPTDNHGLVVDALPDLVRFAGATPKLIYCIPNFQNPSGTTMPAHRRERLLELAERWNAVIVDDDPYGVLRFEGERQPTFHELSPNNPRIVSTRTFSKILAPGLRVGWLDVSPEVTPLIVAAKQAMDTCTSVPMQHLVADFMKAGYLDEHLGRVIPMYRERRDRMRTALASTFGDDAVATDPSGGFFLWLALKNQLSQVDTEALVPDAIDAGVAYIPGPAFSTRGDFRNALRLCFATNEPARIDEGVRRLSDVLYRAAGERGAA
ncbi:PLP-dependent aminotransferase family protein [uncultured Agrococcus sp.]|uniref:aminotransferase-like domain-containing protein n=1 Tax=uncultured Agrococcus sp. TaxID=382258 RepID=UPI0025DB293B|nr:PLP-dependent aminotransferase family protein [uncultured Agrococcus sp.]